MSFGRSLRACPFPSQKVLVQPQLCSRAVLGLSCRHREFMAYRTSLLAGSWAFRTAIHPGLGGYPLCRSAQQQKQHAYVAGDLIKRRLSSNPAAADGADFYAVKKLPTPTLAVVGSDKRFPVRRVYCVGSNYREHVREMGGNPDKAPPFFFTKPPDAAVDVSKPGGVVNYPPESEDFQHEVEMVVAIGTGGRGISRGNALRHVFAYGVGVDLTRRDMQRVAKKAGRPWDCSKGFDRSGPVGALTPLSDCAAGEGGPGDEKCEIWLRVGGEMRQKSVLGEMIWTVPEMISRLSELFTLEAGDLLFTGTPAGVSPLKIDDCVEAGVEGLAPCRFTVGPLLPPTGS